MSIFNFLNPKSSEPNIHSLLVDAVWKILVGQRCEGATTGLLMSRIKQTDLGRMIKKRAPQGELNQYFKTIIGHALDELEAQNLVHCDSVGKRQMIGDRRSCSVWRTRADYEALQRHCHWMFRGPRNNGNPEYASRLRTYFTFHSTIS